jgi:hypothetical protein
MLKNRGNLSQRRRAATDGFTPDLPTITAAKRDPVSELV